MEFAYSDAGLCVANLHKLPRLHSKGALLQIARQICDKCRTGCKEYL